jgi:hypothetical protein
LHTHAWRGRTTHSGRRSSLDRTAACAPGPAVSAAGPGHGI